MTLKRLAASRGPHYLQGHVKLNTNLYRQVHENEVQERSLLAQLRRPAMSALPGKVNLYSHQITKMQKEHEKSRERPTSGQTGTDRYLDFRATPTGQWQL